MAQHNQTGIKGEELARKFLQKKNYKILERNWRHEKEEVDIIALDGKELVIVEVKTRSTDYFGDPEEAVDVAKETRLIAAAEAYLEENDFDFEVRYDIISIILKNKHPEIRHIQDAFYPQ
ncbi:MAG: YraN family protein [Bacteroidales bacterium]|nr:YraN family protein [Bacteroidales bacterium]